MQRSIRFVVLSIVLLVLGLLIGPAGAQEAPDSPDVAACLPGAGYASGCDVDQDGDVDIFDIQLTAGRWNTSGAYTSSHTHWGETWTGTGSHGLRMENTVASGVAYGIYGKSVSTGGVGVYGEAGAGSGDTWGVYGWSQSTAGHGVYGNASASSIENNAFRIAGGEPGMKVSWMVTGIRHDAYANAHRIPVEEAKPAEERGLYLHPVELGQPAELGLDYQRNLDRSREMP